MTPTITQIAEIVRTKGAIDARIGWVEALVRSDGTPHPSIGGFWRCEAILSETYFSELATSKVSQEECLTAAFKRAEARSWFTQMVHSG